VEFYLGTDNPRWLEVAGVRLFVSHIRLRPRKRLPVAVAPWALDSGGFTQLKDHGKWLVGPDEYIEAVYRYRDGIGLLEWAAPQDWMCEPWIIAKTGLTVEQHQRNTVENFLYLLDKAPDLPFIPVLQGWTREDYSRCIRMYASAGVDLTRAPIVGVGSVCRRQKTYEINNLMAYLYDGAGLSMHGFGVKTLGLSAYSRYLTSADSMAWSFTARRDPVRLPGCPHEKCVHCLKWALVWRERVLALPSIPTPSHAPADATPMF
jgi:hypothetical protein